MMDITDNKFTNDFIEGMVKENRIPSKRSAHSYDLKKENISRSEILACWDNGLSYYYKDEDRTRRTDYFIQANSDGSEFLVNYSHFIRKALSIFLLHGFLSHMV